MGILTKEGSLALDGGHLPGNKDQLHAGSRDPRPRQPRARRERQRRVEERGRGLHAPGPAAEGDRRRSARPAAFTPDEVQDDFPATRTDALPLRRPDRDEDRAERHQDHAPDHRRRGLLFEEQGGHDDREDERQAIYGLRAGAGAARERTVVDQGAREGSPSNLRDEDPTRSCPRSCPGRRACRRTPPKAQVRTAASVVVTARATVGFTFSSPTLVTVPSRAVRKALPSARAIHIVRWDSLLG